MNLTAVEENSPSTSLATTSTTMSHLPSLQAPTTQRPASAEVFSIPKGFSCGREVLCPQPWETLLKNFYYGLEKLHPTLWKPLSWIYMFLTGGRSLKSKEIFQNSSWKILLCRTRPIAGTFFLQKTKHCDERSKFTKDPNYEKIVRQRMGPDQFEFLLEGPELLNLVLNMTYSISDPPFASLRRHKLQWIFLLGTCSMIDLVPHIRFFRCIRTKGFSSIKGRLAATSCPSKRIYRGGWGCVVFLVILFDGPPEFLWLCELCFRLHTCSNTSSLKLALE